MSEVLPPAVRRWTGDVLHHEGWMTLVTLASHSDNRVFRIGAGDVQYVLKLVAPGRAHAFAHERAITDYLAAHGFPVPRVIAATNLPELPETVTLRTWIPGHPARAAYNAMDGAERNALVSVLAAILARVHHMPLDEVRDFWQYPEDHVNTPVDWATNFVRKKIASDLARIADALPEAVRADLADEVTAWGEWLATTSVPLAPLHSDYYLENVLLNDGAVTGVLDWEAARVGDPLWDLARTQVAAFADAPDAFARFCTVYGERVPWVGDAARIRRYRLLMAMGDLRYAVRHAPVLIPARVPPVVTLWQQCMETEG